MRLIDRQTSGDFALELFKQFAATRADAADRWVLTVSGMLGDDRIVPTLNSLIQHWGDAAPGKMAEYGVQALALLGTDAALDHGRRHLAALSHQEQEYRRGSHRGFHRSCRAQGAER